MFLVYHLKDNNLPEITDYRSWNKLHVEIVPKNRLRRPAIWAQVIKPEEKEDVRLDIPFSRTIQFKELKNETGVWKTAQDTVYEADDFIQQKFLG